MSTPTELNAALNHLRRGLKLPPDTVIARDDGVVAVRDWASDNYIVVFLDLVDRWEMELVIPVPVHVDKLVEIWNKGVADWHRVMEEKHAA